MVLFQFVNLHTYLLDVVININVVIYMFVFMLYTIITKESIDKKYS